MSNIKFKQPIQLPKISSNPIDLDSGVIYYSEVLNKVVMTQDGVVTDTVSSLDLSEAVQHSITDLVGTASPDWDTLGEIETNTLNHINNISNPHSVTKDQVGLGNCDNTSDLDKPVSNAVSTLLDSKQPLNTKLTNISNLATNGILVKDSDSFVCRNITSTSPISTSNGDGISGNISITHDDSGVVATSYGAEDKSIIYTVNSKGHVTASDVVDSKPKKLNYIRVSGTSTVQTTSSTYSTISGMSVTPPAGSYIVTFSGNVFATGIPHSGNVSFFLDSTQINTTIRTIEYTAPLLGTSTNAISAGHISDIVEFNGSQTLTVRFNRTDGTIYCAARTLILIRVN